MDRVGNRKRPLGLVRNSNELLLTNKSKDLFALFININTSTIYIYISWYYGCCIDFQRKEFFLLSHSFSLALFFFDCLNICQIPKASNIFIAHTCSLFPYIIHVNNRIFIFTNSRSLLFSINH